MEEGKVLTPEEKAERMQPITGEQPVDKKEVVREDVKEEVKEEKTEDTPTEFDYGDFSKRFGREIGDEQSLKSLFEKADEYETVKESNGKMTEQLTEYKSLAEKLNPMEYFANEDEYVRQQFLKNNKLGDDAIKALSTMSPSKVGELSNTEAIKLNLMVDKELSSEEADAYMSKHYDVDDFSDELDAGVSATLKVDGKDAKNSLGKLYDGIEVPEKVDYETARTQLKDSWDNPISELVKGIDKIQLEEGLDFVVTDAMKEGMEEATLQYVMSKQMSPSEDAGAQIAGMIREQLVVQNLSQILKSAKADWQEQFKADTRSKIHNDRPLNDSTRSEKDNRNNDEKMDSVL